MTTDYERWEQYQAANPPESSYDYEPEDQRFLWMCAVGAMMRIWQIEDYAHSVLTSALRLMCVVALKELQHDDIKAMAYRHQLTKNVLWWPESVYKMHKLLGKHYLTVSGYEEYA